jgi:hypothetical protein
MSDRLFNQFARGMARLNTALNATFGRDGARCFLLKREPKSKTFDLIDELVSGYRIEYSDLREEIFFYYATESDIADEWSQVTHIGYGVPTDADQVFVYQIQPNQKERTTPDVNSHEWKCFAVRLPNERY